MSRIFTPILLSLLGFASVFAQSTEDIAEAERKSGHNLMTFSANAHTGNYDVVYHKLDLAADPTVHFISGTVTTDFIAKEDMTEVVFDLAFELVVSQVQQNGNNLAFAQNENDELVITLPATLAAGNQARVEITYSGAPPTENEAFVIGTHSGAPVLWTLSEPYGAKDWWPCKQDLIDKIDSLDVYITAPAEYVAVSNGVEIPEAGNGTITKTTHFRHQYPIPAYLVAIAISNYGIFTQQAGTAPNNFPIVNYLYPESQTQNEQNLAVTIPIMDFYEQTFETYPFHNEKYGHAQCGFGGGMEHTTVSFMGSFGRNLIAHELAHQWFGDKITCGSWKDIWLNEGFATYLSGMVIEHLDGNEAFRNWKLSNVANITSLPDGNVYLTDNDTIDSNRIFSSRLTYNKGAMVLNMLRVKLSDPVFFQALKAYLADTDLAYAYAKTPQLQAHLEAASGLDLTEFFNDWIYNQGYPVYTITVDNIESGKAQVTISQQQSHESVSFFEMGVPIRLLGPEGEVQDYVLENTANNQDFIIDVPFTATQAIFDPKSDIISRNSTITVTGDYFTPYLYPSPANTLLTAALADGVIAKEAIIYNTLGQRVLETNGASSWDVSGFATGVYFMTLHTNTGTTELKFLKN
ncbi:M1 family aminopeptidase [Flavobacterium suzhouense]|uniref:Aminopeptidase N n=1 Tax=Flavobacterium suzhouense TaxID=1529638 RepID=A0ABW5NQY0_9FLAO